MLKYTWLCLAVINTAIAVDYLLYPEVVRFQEYIRINTTTGVDFEPAVAFWKKLAAAQNVTITKLELVQGCPILILEWLGSDPTLQSIMLHSYMDVVPANEEDGWTYPPFSGHITSDGNIWGRGTQDMKSVSIQHYEALSRLKARGEVLKRTIYMTLTPDEEIGARCGMIPFLNSQEFRLLNVSVVFDEGAPYSFPYIPVFYQDKVIWQIQVDCYGLVAHGAKFLPINSTATGKCQNVINTLLEFREEQYKIFSAAPKTNAGAYTSVNLNKVNAGTVNNVIPKHMSVVFDIRLGTKVNEVTFANQLSDWIEAAGPNVTLTYIVKNPQSPATIINDSNPYWRALVDVANDLNITFTPVVPPGSTIARFVRAYGIPAFGISPMPNTQPLLHAVDEHLSIQTFLKGIEIFERIFKAIANLAGNVTGTDPSIYVENTSG